MTTEAKQQVRSRTTCSSCANRYEVKYNTPNGLDAVYYCKNSSKKMPYGFLLTHDEDSCNNYKPKENGTED